MASTTTPSELAGKYTECPHCGSTLGMCQVHHDHYTQYHDFNAETIDATEHYTDRVGVVRCAECEKILPV